MAFSDKPAVDYKKLCDRAVEYGAAFHKEFDI